MSTTNGVQFVIDHRHPGKLKNHPFNQKVYDSQPKKDFVEDVRENGVEEPIVILKNDVIVSGHRRRQAAMIVGIKSVPVIVKLGVNPDDDLTVRRLILTCNKQREKSMEEKAREYDALMAILAEEAELRQKTSQIKPGNNKLVRVSINETRPEKQGKKHDSRQIAAKEVGMSGVTAVKASAVIKEIAKAEAKGDKPKAETLRIALNKNVSAAHRLVKAEAIEDLKTPFDEPLAEVNWVCKTAIARIREISLTVERQLGRNKGDFDSQKIAKQLTPVFSQFDAVKGVLANCQQRYRRNRAK